MLKSQTWLSQLGWLFRRHLLLKTAGITGFTALFFVGYFHMLRHPVHPVTVMPLTALDRLIEFDPSTLPAYVSLWLYVGIAPGLMPDLRRLLHYGAWIAAMCLAGLTSFYFFPTAVPPSGIVVDTLAHPGFALLQGVDAAGNACPSLHVATALFTACWVHWLLRQIGAPFLLKAVNGVWLLLIVHATMATKQHVALDVLAGTVLALAFVVPSMRWHPRPWPLDPPSTRGGPA